MTPFSANIDLSSLDGSNGFRLTGEWITDDGPSVASAGDVNGDGFADLIVGDRFASLPWAEVETGASYVVFGKPGHPVADIDLSSLDGSTGFRLTGAAWRDLCGESVALAGDVNGDGFADVIVGAPCADPHGADERGEGPHAAVEHKMLTRCRFRRADRRAAVRE